MKYKKLNIDNEFTELKSVLLAPSLEFSLQQKRLSDILIKHNIEINWANLVPGANYQFFIRDPFMVIGDTFVINHMKEKERQSELLGINEFLAKIEPTRIIYTPINTFIEGGDVIPHDKKIFVGQEGTRTDQMGLKFLKENFGAYDVIPILMQFDKKKMKWLHLDCIFNPIWYDTAIIFPDAIKEESLKVIKSIFPNIIKITEKEQRELAINILSLGNKTVIMQERHTRIIKELKSKGFKIETINYYMSIDLDGYNRCMTCPIERI